MADFNKAQIGDKVYCLKNGYGRIVDTNNEPFYHILVAFSNYQSSYTRDGKIGNQMRLLHYIGINLKLLNQKNQNKKLLKN